MGAGLAALLVLAVGTVGYLTVTDERPASRVSVGIGAGPSRIASASVVEDGDVCTALVGAANDRVVRQSGRRCVPTARLAAKLEMDLAFVSGAVVAERSVILYGYATATLESIGIRRSDRRAEVEIGPRWRPEPSRYPQFALKTFVIRLTFDADVGYDASHPRAVDEYVPNLFCSFGGGVTRVHVQPRLPQSRVVYPPPGKVPPGDVDKALGKAWENLPPDIRRGAGVPSPVGSSVSIEVPSGGGKLLHEAFLDVHGDLCSTSAFVVAGVTRSKGGGGCWQLGSLRAALARAPVAFDGFVGWDEFLLVRGLARPDLEGFVVRRPRTRAALSSGAPWTVGGDGGQGLTVKPFVLRLWYGDGMLRASGSRMAPASDSIDLVAVFGDGQTAAVDVIPPLAPGVRSPRMLDPVATSSRAVSWVGMGSEAARR
jgi:hypothetical protein